MTDDIGKSNERQSDFYQGWEDAKANKAMKPNPSQAYWDGYMAGLPRGSRNEYAETSWGEPI